MELVKTIDKEDCDFEVFKGYHKSQFANRLITLSASNMTLKQMSETLSKEFGRKITENAIKGARYRMRDKIDTYKQRAAGEQQ